MTVCRECRGEVSTEAAACPRCGVKDPAKSRILGKIVWNWCLLAIAVGGGYYLWFYVIRPYFDAFR